MTRTTHVSVSISEQVLPTGIPAGREGKAEETAGIHAQLSLQSAVTLTTQKQQWTTLTDMHKIDRYRRTAFLVQSDPKSGCISAPTGNTRD